MTKTRVPAGPSATRRSEHWIEEGAALMEIAGRGASFEAAAATGKRSARRSADGAYDVIVIGAGQAGLSVGYYLARHGLRFVILDACEQIGDSWRKRWDSLRLFTPARYDALVGMPFPGKPDAFPTKDEMADYLQAYAARFELPVRSGVRVERLSHQDGRYIVSAGDLELEADHVVVAMANYQERRVPPFASELRPDIVQLHSSDYRNPSQLRDGGVLIAGAGNSGSEIALELARDHKTWMSGRDTGHIPFRIEGLAGRYLLVRLVLRFLFHRVLTVDTPLGRSVRRKVLSQGGPLIRVKPKDLAAAGIERIPRIAGVEEGLPRLEDGRVLDVSNVVWCTGFEPGFSSWIDLPIFGTQGEPLHERGLAADQPGLYFVGLHFLYSMSSTMIHGVSRDAARIVQAIVARTRTRSFSASPFERHADQHDREPKISLR
jgi:putative flavoprotein involved in K+ transport